MKDWKEVFGTEETQPVEYDTTSSSDIAYQRKNVQRYEKQNEDGSTTVGWLRDEREMTQAEMQEMMLSYESPAIQMVMQTLSDIQLQLDLLS